MNIIILGAGRVGESVTEHLVSEHNDITVIDSDARLLQNLQDRFDVRCIQADGTQPSALEEAGAADADLILACATQDAVNLTVCKTAAMRFNVPQRIARLRSQEWTQHADLLGENGFAITDTICPELSVTRYIQKLVEYPEALQVRTFAGGRAALISAQVSHDAPMSGRTLQTYDNLLPNTAMAVLAIYRRFANTADRFIACQPSTVVYPGDEVFFAVAYSDIRTVLHTVHTPLPEVRQVWITGGGNVGLTLARALQDQVQVKLVDSDASRCEFLTTELNNSVLVLHGDSTDESLLLEENISDTDFFIATTNDDEDNIMSSLLAKQLGATRVLALINRRTYADLVHGTQIDIALSPSQAMMGELLPHVRQGDVVAVHSIRRGRAEALEIVAHGDKHTSRVVGRKIKDIGLPDSCRIGLIVRGLPNNQSNPLAQTVDPVVINATPDTEIQSGDHAIIFVSERRQVLSVEKLFRVKPTFF